LGVVDELTSCSVKVGGFFRAPRCFVAPNSMVWLPGPGGVEPLGFVWILKGLEAASTSWLRDRHLMKLFAFDRNAT
jgi:hypothetical protein